MSPHRTAVSESGKTHWIGRAMTALAALFMLFDGAMKLIPHFGPVEENFARLGYVPEVGPGIGTLELTCVALYVLPRTSILGAILLTGYLGGAIATHVRVGDPLLSHILFPVYVALLIWGGLFLREGRVRALIPFRAEATRNRKEIEPCAI